MKSSQLNSVLKDQMGIEQGTEAIFKKDKKTMTVWKWIADGGKTEDYGIFEEHDYLTTRAYNHFHDPLENWDDAGLDNIVLNQLYWGTYSRYPVSAVLWGLKPGEQEFLLNFTGDWSWGKARDCFYHALTDLTEDQRNQNFADCFRALGQVMHLLQESSVPLHTRNDAHIFPIVGKGPWTYETFTEEYKDRFDYTACRPDPVLLTDPQPDQNYSNMVPISGLFDRNQYKKGDSIPLHNNTIGIAEYSNANFLTEDTMWAYQHPSLADTNYDRIDWLNPEQIDAEDGLVDNRLYIRKEVGEQIEHLAVLDYWSREYQAHEERIPRAYSLDKVCWNDYQKKLIPRAVGYSAALLDYFFRGKLEVEFVFDGLKITNKSGERMRDGYFELYYDNAEGERQAIEIYSGAKVTALEPDDSQVITFDPPEGAASYIIVYRGGLGNEADAVVGKKATKRIRALRIGWVHPDTAEFYYIVWDYGRDALYTLYDSDGQEIEQPVTSTDIIDNAANSPTKGSLRWRAVNQDGYIIGKSTFWNHQCVINYVCPQHYDDSGCDWYCDSTACIIECGPTEGKDSCEDSYVNDIPGMPDSVISRNESESCYLKVHNDRYHGIVSVMEDNFSRTEAVTLEACSRWNISPGTISGPFGDIHYVNLPNLSEEENRRFAWFWNWFQYTETYGVLGYDDWTIHREDKVYWHSIFDNDPSTKTLLFSTSAYSCDHVTAGPDHGQAILFEEGKGPSEWWSAYQRSRIGLKTCRGDAVVQEQYHNRNKILRTAYDDTGGMCGTLVEEFDSESTEEVTFWEIRVQKDRECLDPSAGEAGYDYQWDEFVALDIKPIIDYFPLPDSDFVYGFGLWMAAD